MTQLKRVSALILVLLLFGSAVPATAQEGNPFPEFTDLGGLQAAVTRGYQLDFSQFEAAPSGSSEAEFRDAFFLSGVVLEFDSADNASAGYETLVTHGVEPLATNMGMEAPEITESDLADLGDQAHAFSVFNQAESTEGYLRYAIMQQDVYVFLAVIITEAEESSLDTDELLAYFAGQTAEGYTGTGTLAPEAGSTDGLWQFFPPADHELWAGLIPTDDEIFFPSAS